MSLTPEEQFLALRPTEDPRRFELVVTPDICVGPQNMRFMFGGVGLGATIAAMERSCGRPVICATAQFLSFARPPSMVTFEVDLLVDGRHNSQLQVRGHADGRQILAAHGAVGARPGPLAHQWACMPEVPAPDDCPARIRANRSDGLNARLDVRIARSRLQDANLDGRLLLWVRPKEHAVIDAPMLAIMADLAPSGVSNALGYTAYANSLDNMLRIHNVVATDWVLCEISVLSIQGGLGHANINLFSRDGQLMASGGQSFIVRT